MAEYRKVDPFHSFEDLNKVLKYFADHGKISSLAN